MERRRFARRPDGTVELDLCWACHGIWFDQHESIVLAPASVMELFGAIDAHREKPARPLARASRCPRCSAGLLETQDIQRTNRITYLRCPQGHGRFTTFYQFLREKNFVRTLTQGEIQRLRATVQQVRCSSCGGGVAIERDMACAYCGAPVSILDADAVRKTIEELSPGGASRPAVDVDAIAARVLGRPRQPKSLDLVGEALHMLFARV